MVNQTLLWLFALPVCVAVAIWVATFRIVASWLVSVCYALISFLVIGLGFFLSTAHKTLDYEVWNGQVIEKKREHDTYDRSYDCFCTTDSNGNRSCQTCTETHYTVDWTVFSDIGNFTIESLDSTFSSVYKTPDPPRYSSVNLGDPVSKLMRYTNYVQAVPNSLFSPASKDLKEKFAPLLPQYPDQIYDFYKVDRFLTPGWDPEDAQIWNEEISKGLRVLGPKKQVNLIIVIAKTDDPDYEYALIDHWEGANKNDVVILIGSTAYPKIDFVRVISWTKNQLFKVELRDIIMQQGTIDRRIIQHAFQQIEKNFERRRMVEFEYLRGEVDPPDWVIIFLIVVVCVGGVVTLFNMKTFSDSLTGTRTYKPRRLRADFRNNHRRRF